MIHITFRNKNNHKTIHVDMLSSYGPCILTYKQKTPNLHCVGTKRFEVK